jgi:TetR/AcrR family transcriptional regulator, cholesterol catabolism regulator
VMVNEWNLFAQFPRFEYLRKIEQDTEHLWVGVIERGVDEGAFRADLDPSMLYRLLRDAIWVSVRWYRPSGRDNAEQIADAYLSVVFGGIAQHGG